MAFVSASTALFAFVSTSVDAPVAGVCTGRVKVPSAVFGEMERIVATTLLNLALRIRLDLQ